MTSRLYPGLKAVGQSLWVGNIAYEIVGVVADYSNNTFQPHERDPKAYLTFAQGQTEPKQRQFLIRAADDPTHIVRDVRQRIIDAAAGNTIGQAFTVDQIIDIGGQEILVGTAPLAPLTITGLLLTTTGIYGVLAFAITRRSRELAVRVAVGASGRDLIRLVSAHSFGLVTTGALIGIGVTFALSRIVRASGGAGSFYDPAWTSFVVPIAIIAAIGAVATWIPARRATKVDPSTLLRTT